MKGDWTASAALPGGEIPNADYTTFFDTLRSAYPWMPRDLAVHYGRLYGARTRDVIGDASSLAGLGRHFGRYLYEAEVHYLVSKEWAQTAEDVIWRRTKERLRMTDAERTAFEAWFNQAFSRAA